ncbi:MAG: hypothetical protein ABSB41_04595 [Anaerolineales bacterium]|jgi:hypothetical protein
MSIFIRIFKKWLPLAFATAGLCALVYLSVQQSLRQGANDPQIQMVEDAAGNLKAGASLESVVPSTNVEIANSLAPFIMVFDNAGNVLASSATLHGAVPSFPTGVLDYTRQNGEDRVTWQPEAGVRMATVIVGTGNGFVLAGRSLREVEVRESNVENYSLLAMLAIWVVTFILITVGELLAPEKGA